MWTTFHLLSQQHDCVRPWAGSTILRLVHAVSRIYHPTLPREDQNTPLTTFTDQDNMFRCTLCWNSRVILPPPHDSEQLLQLDQLPSTVNINKVMTSCAQPSTLPVQLCPLHPISCTSMITNICPHLDTFRFCKCGL